MAQFPALPLFTDAYLGDTMHLTTIEHGAYLLLLMAMWRSKTGHLPNDDLLLARTCRLTPAQWRRIKPTIWVFLTVDAHGVTQGRLIDERGFRKQHSKSQSDKARARWLKNNNTTDAAEQPKGCPPSLPPSLTTFEKNGGVERGREDNPADASPTFDQFWSSWPLSKTAKDAASRAYGRLSPENRTRATAEAASWCAVWRANHPRASDIHPATYLNNKRWEDDQSSTVRPFPGGPHERPAYVDRRQQAANEAARTLHIAVGRARPAAGGDFGDG